MTRTFEIAAAADLSSWTDVGAVVDRRTFKLGGRAYNGESTPSGFNFADDAGTAVLPAHRVVRVTEDATVSPTVIFWGRIQDKSIGRGQMFDDDAKAFDVGLDDVNSELRGISIIRWDRGAETAEARLRAFGAAYLDGSWRASTDLDCATYVPLTHTTMLPAKKYRGTTGGEVIDDVMTATGKLLFVTQDRELFFDQPTSTAYASTIAISDAQDDDGETIFAPEWNGSANESSGDQVTSGGVATYASGSVVSKRRTAVETSYDRWEDAISSDAKTGSGAQGDLGRMLDGHATEEDTIRCSVYFRADQVDLLKHGMTLPFRGGAAAVTSPITVRVASCEKVEVGEDRYRYDLELGFPRKIRGRINHGKSSLPPPPPTTLPPPGGGGVCTVDFSTALGGFVVQENDDMAGNSITGSGGGMAITADGDKIEAESPQSFSLPATILASVLMPAGIPGPGTGTPHLAIGVNKPGGTFCQQGVSMSFTSSGGLHITTAGGTSSSIVTDIPEGSLVWCRIVINADGSCTASVWPASDPTDIWNVSGSSPVGFATPDAWSVQLKSGTAFEFYTFIIQSIELLVGGDCSAPSGPGGTAGASYGPVDLGVGDGHTTTFQLPYPYAPGTLEVFVAGLGPVDVAETDPDAGTFDLGFAPTSLETIKVVMVIQPAATSPSPGVPSGGTSPGGTTGGGSGSSTGDAGDVYGSAIAMDSKSNWRVGPDGILAHRFRASTTSDLLAIRFPQRGGPTHADPSADGYSSQNGDGGRMTIEVHADDGSGLAPDPTVLATMTIEPPNPTGNWETYDRYEWDTPAGLTAGDLFWIIFDDPDSPDAYISVNHGFVFGSPLSPRQPAYPDADYAVYGSTDAGATWDLAGQFTAVLDLEYADSTHDGQCYHQLMTDLWATISGNAQVRETLVVSGGDKTLDEVFGRLRRTAGVDDVTITVEQDDGTFIDSVAIPYSDVPISAPGSDNGGSVWAGGALGAAQTLLDGQGYHIRFSCPSTSTYTMAPIREGTTEGLASFAFRDGHAEKTSDATTWVRMYPYDEVDLQWYGHMP